VKTVVSLLLVSVVIGAVAALAAAAISSLTSATLSPTGGALLGVAFGITGDNLTVPRRSGTERFGMAVARALVAGGTAALVVALLQR
jgi:hypothetical protein